MNQSAIFNAAVKLLPEQRPHFLEAACGGDPQLQDEVAALLREHDGIGSFISRPAVAVSPTDFFGPLTEGPGTRIGPYKLLQPLGEGGMGVVYMAEQEQPLRRRVALKIIKPGMDSAQVIARFEVERQALALMDHQNIARVLDAGTTDSGRPYFVMELVYGVPITQYCDANKLSPWQRLELFVAVCQAIQHAHQKGIIHRDLKPSNVLITLHDGKPVPKVIDFGVAKATEQRLTERTLFTQYGTIVGTLEYMAPEQAEMSGLGVDTRSDIYALGVLLYELLTGTTPLERGRLREAAYDEMLRLIREEEPPRPSRRISTSGDRLATISAERSTEPAQLSRLVHGELDWIVMRCLEKDRTRRYETANGLARDVERYLHDEPVEACPPTASYKLCKFARKHRAGLVTAAAFAALLVLGTVVSAWQALRATQAEAAALANEHQANTNAVQARDKEEEANRQRNEAQLQRDEAQKQRDEVHALNEKLQATQAELRGTLYAAHMNLAQQAWVEGGTERVRELLERHLPRPGERDLRGLEWYYLYRQSHAEILTIPGGGWRVAFSPDGKRLAGLNVWDAQTGQRLLSLGPPSFSVAFSPDGKRVASAIGGHIRVSDAQTGQELLSLKCQVGGYPAGRVAFSPDGKRLAGTDDKTVKVWDAQTGHEILSLKVSTMAIGLAFSPDGKRLASSDDKTVEVWDVQTGQETLSLKGHTGTVNSMAFSPDGKRLASSQWGAAGQGTVKVWDAQTGQELLSLKGAGVDVAYSPDGKCLASGSGGAGVEGAVTVWDAQTGQEILTLKGHSSGVTSVAFSPDGKRLASSQWGAAGRGTVKVWDAQARPNPLVLKGAAASSVASLAFSPDGKRLASGSDGLPGSGTGAVTVWDTQTGQETLALKGHNGPVISVVFSPDGKRLASGNWDSKRGGEVKVWDAQTGQQLLSLLGGGYTVVFSPDAKRLASAGYHLERPGEVKVWDAQTGQQFLSLKGAHPHGDYSVAFSPDGKRLASGAGWPGGGLPGAVYLWDAQTGERVLSLHGRGLPPERDDPRDAQTGERVPINGHRGSVLSVAFSPDGKRLASASLDGMVKIWDAQTGQELLTCNGHIHAVRRVIFSPDGKRLVSTGSGGLKVWDAHSGQELLTLKGVTVPVALSPDGHWLATAREDSTVTIWDATPLPEK